MSHLDVYDLLIVTFLLFLPVLSHLLPLKLFVYLRLIIGILSLCISAYLTVLSLFDPALNLTFSLLPITYSHPHASASDLTFDFWRYVNIWLTLTLCWQLVSTCSQVTQTHRHPPSRTWRVPIRILRWSWIIPTACRSTTTSPLHSDVLPPHLSRSTSHRTRSDFYAPRLSV